MLMFFAEFQDMFCAVLNTAIIMLSLLEKI